MKLSVLLTLKPTPMIKDLLELMYESIENAVEDYEILFSTADLSEKSIRWISKWKNARPIDVGNNTSRAHFWNVGFNQVSPDSDWIFLFDLDSILFKNSVRKMIELIESDFRIGAVSANLNHGIYGFQNFNLNISDEMELPDAVEKFELEHRNEKFISTFLEGSCLIARRDLLEKIKSQYGFIVDERFSTNLYDDMDLSMRILCEDLKMEVAPTYAYQIETTRSEDFEEQQTFARKLFESIWGFSASYSLLSRIDILQMIPDLRRTGIQILEVGCAAGGTLYMIRNENPLAKLYGIEINPHSAKIASTFAEVENIDVEKFAPDHWHDKFDYIICGDVIEHLVNPWNALKNMRSMLKSDGHLLASIPNVANIGVVENLLRGFWDYQDQGILDRTHLRFFTRDSIIRTFLSEKFTIRNIISKQLGHQNYLLPLAKEFGERFNVELDHFMTFQYLVDATK